MIAAIVFALALPQATPIELTTPTPSPSPAPGSSASPVAGPTPTPTAKPVYNFVWKPQELTGSTPFPELGAPQFLEIDVTDQTITAPGPLHVRILTSDSVVSVVASSYGYEFKFPKSGTGLFTLDTEIPEVPNSVKGKRFDVEVTATAKNGRVATLTLPFMLK